MSEPFIGQISIFGFNFAPRGWAFCDGQILSISQNTALFALLGTIYGGNGSTTFALPDLRGRAPVHMGQGPGLSPVVIGQKSGVEQVTLSIAQMPSHAHTFAPPASTSPASTNNPANATPARTPGNNYAPDPSGVFMDGGNTGTVGGSQPVDIRNPYLALNFSIALEGIFPSRD